MAPRYAVILNPYAGRGRGAKLRPRLLEFLRSRGWLFDFYETRGPGHASELAGVAARKADILVIVGGDGTVNEVVNGLIKEKVPRPLGLIPIGSGNDFSRMFGIPRKPKEAVEVIEEGKARPIDVGWANGRYFPNGLGIGFDAWVTHESNKVQNLRGMAIYLYAVFKCALSYKAPHMTIRWSNQCLEGRIFFVTVGNGVSLGGGFLLTPRALNDDGLFDICVVESLKKHEIFLHLPKALKGTHDRIPQTHMFRTDHIVIESRDGLAAHVDGEILTMDTPRIEARIVPQALEVIYNSQSRGVSSNEASGTSSVAGRDLALGRRSPS